MAASPANNETRFAEFTVADERFCFSLPADYCDAAAAALLCAGLIGYRCLRKTGAATTLGIYGLGAAAHFNTQVARHECRRVFAFTRPGDTTAQQFDRTFGMVWAGGTDQSPPEELDAAILFAPAGELAPLALRTLAHGGTVVCGGIHMSDIPAFPYERLWHERTIWLRGQSHPAGWRGFSRAGAEDPGENGDAHLSAGGGE